MSQPAMPNPSEFPTRTAPASNGWAISSLVLGIASFCLFFITGVPAIILGVIGLVRANNSEGRVGGQGLAVAGMILGTLGTFATLIGIALLLPAVHSVRGSARRSVSSSNLRQLSMAANQFQMQNSVFPEAAGAPEGAPVSWRLQIAPYVEGAAVAERYDPTQPWDSVQNLPLSEDMPRVFLNPSLEDVPAGTTNYLALAGEESAFPPEGSVERLPAPAQTILFVETNSDRAVPWTQPKDLDYDPTDPLNGLGGLRPGGAFVVVFGDGSVHTLGSDIDPEVFHALVTRQADDNNRIGDPLR